jgi:fatty-acyl-CoA synthase
MKIDKQRLRRQAWEAELVWWRPGRGSKFVPLEEGDRMRLRPLLGPLSE